MENIREMNLDEMEEIIGGRNEKGYEYKPADSKIPKGCELYQIQRGDTLKKIAEARGLTTADILKYNKNIVNPSVIVAGFWLFVPKV